MYKVEYRKDGIIVNTAFFETIEQRTQYLFSEAMRNFPYDTATLSEVENAHNNIKDKEKKVAAYVHVIKTSDGHKVFTDGADCIDYVANLIQSSMRAELAYTYCEVKPTDGGLI